MSTGGIGNLFVTAFFDARVLTWTPHPPKQLATATAGIVQYGFDDPRY
jgi:hypothetical protein